MPVFAAQFVIGPSGIVDTSDAAAMRTALGLESASTVASSAFAPASHTQAHTTITGLGSAALSASTAFALASHTQAPQTIAGATTTGQVMISLTDGTFTAARLTAGSGVTLTHGSGSITLSAGVSGLQTKLFDAPAESWRGVTANRPEADIPSVSGMTSSSYCLSFDSATVETCQRNIGSLPDDSTWLNDSVAMSIVGHALSATSGSIAWVLAARQTITGAWTGAFTNFATVSAALPANTGSAYTSSYIGSVSSLGWSAGATIELQLNRLTTGAATHAADSLFHGLTAYRRHA